MNRLEQQLDFPLVDRVPEAGQAIPVAPGVQWARMKLPFALDHVNVWLLRDSTAERRGWTIVDCGIDDARTRSDWQRLFEHALEGEPVLRVIVTHMHPDHIGLAHWLCERWNAPLWISATDYYAARLACSSTSAGGPESAAFMTSHGLADPKVIEGVKARGRYYSSLVPAVPKSFHRLMDGATVDVDGRDWRCHVGYGHAPEHMSLHAAELGVLISGDMVLPRISTNVSVFEIEPEGNPLTLYLESIERMRSLPADTLVLPSHGRPFKGLHTRIDQLRDHHAERFGEVLETCSRSPCSAADVMPVLFKRELDVHQTTFAIGESIAHLHALWLEGKLVRSRGDDGVFRFAAVR